jgi:hypothetical protein
MMTRKDYVKVAELLYSQKVEIHKDVFATLVDQFCDLFFEDNPNFSPNRFEMACYGNDEMADVK